MIEWGELLATLIFLETAGSGATFGEYPTQLYATANLSMGTENYVCWSDNGSRRMSALEKGQAQSHYIDKLLLFGTGEPPSKVVMWTQLSRQGRVVLRTLLD